MIPLTITYGHLSVDRSGNGDITIVRTDRKESVRLSRTEWAFVLKCAEIYGMPVVPSASLTVPEST